MVDAVDYKGMTAGEFHTSVGMDGAKWTDAFRQHFPQVFEAMEKEGFKDFEGTMLGWFCNAIMAGYDKARAKYDPAEKAMREKFGLPDPEIVEGKIGEMRGMAIMPARHAEDLKDGTHMMSDYKISPELDMLLKKAVERVNAMTPEERSEMFLQQKISWVYGEIGIENPNSTITREEVERMVRDQHQGLASVEVDNAIEDIVDVKTDLVDALPDFGNFGSAEIGEIAPPCTIDYTTDINDPDARILSVQTHRVPAVGEIQTFFNEVENVSEMSEDMHARLNKAAGRLYEVIAVITVNVVYAAKAAETTYKVLLEDVTDEYASINEVTEPAEEPTV